MEFFFVATNTDRIKLLREQKVNKWLITYISLYNKAITFNNWQNIVLTMPENEKIFIDSGAHSLQKTDEVNLKEIDSYFESYFNFIKDNYNNIFSFVEMDIEDQIGQDKVDYYYAQLKTLDKTGKKLIRVFHPNNHNFDKWKQYCNESKFVGFGGKWKHHGNITVENSFMLKCLKYAYDNKNSVHGFGCSSSILTKFPFTTADSNSWMACEMFGQYIEFKNSKIIIHDSLKSVSKSSKKEIKNLGVMNDNLSKKISAIKAYKEFEEYITKLWKSRGIIWEHN